MIKSYTLSDLDINFLNIPEVIKAKQQIDKLSDGSIYFSIDGFDIIKNILYENLGTDLFKLNSIPMRWIKGDTKPHIDNGIKSFEKTYLVYLTDSQGELIIDSKSYPINKGNAYVFDEGLSHQTVGTGSEPRLLLGPMSESGISVGGATTIQANGATEIIYIRYDAGSGTTYKINNGSYNGFSLPLTIENINPLSSTLQVLFETDIVLSNPIWYIICGSESIQFGSTSLNSDGTRPIITIDGVTNYPGLISNGTSSSSGYSNIYIFNLEVRAINGSNQPSDGGWIGQSYFGKQSSNNFIINCSSSGPIIDGGGGIIGGYSGSESGASLYITGCSSSGISGSYSGGIIGFYAGYLGGQVICESCWSTGFIGTYAGGIFGFYAGNATGLAEAIKCYSTGFIGTEAGGIFGSYAGYDNGTAIAQKCYSQGPTAGGSDAGGIFGSYAGFNNGQTPATNCYSSEVFTLGNGIYGSNGSWSDLVANSQLTGTPNPIVGTIWVASGGMNYPYELNNMGYTPYTIENIVFQGVGGTSILNQSYNQSISVGESSLAAIRNGYSYDILKKTGGSASSYGTIIMNDNTGIISTTSATLSGTYIITLRNTGSYNITTFTLTVNEVPNVPICFPAGTPVLTDQGEIEIDKINIKNHTIKRQKIIAITQSIPDDSYLICIEKNSLAYNVPNRRTIISKDHKIMCDKKLVRAEYLIQYIPTIYKIPYNKQKLYNVLLNEHSTMMINNLIVETMNPNNILAKVYSGNYTTIKKNEIIRLLNKITTQKRKKSIMSKNIYIA